MSKSDAIAAALRKDLGVEDKLYVYNAYVDGLNYEDHVYYMDEFDDVMGQVSPIDVAARVINGSYRPNDEYFEFDVYGDVYTLNEREFVRKFDNNSQDIAEDLADGNFDPQYLELPDSILDLLDED